MNLNMLATVTEKDDKMQENYSTAGNERCVLFGTCCETQFDPERKYSTYSLEAGEIVDETACRQINEIWLLCETKSIRSFSARYVGVKSGSELVSQYGYPAANDNICYKRHLLFILGDAVDYRQANTAKSDKIKIAGLASLPPSAADTLKNWLEAAPKNGTYVPEMDNFAITALSSEGCCVCEPQYQMTLWEYDSKADSANCVPFPAPKKPRFTFIDLFAGIGGIRLGFQQHGGKCVFSSEWDNDAAKTYFCNFGELPHGDIQSIDPKTIPDFDILLAGFPCQPFSIIGDKEGFNHETQGTLFFNIEKILLEKKPKAFLLENVRNLTAHDNGRTFKIILRHLADAGYDVHHKVLNALDYGLPQKRERIIICGFREKVTFDFPPPIPRSQRKTVADILDANAEKDKDLFVRPEIRESRLKRLKDKNFPKPYISHENVAGSVTPHSYSCALRAGASANYILINDERRPSAREMLRLQGFPDEFKIVVGYGKIKHQTGNSVAVPVISAVAKCLIEKMEEIENGSSKLRD